MSHPRFHDHTVYRQTSTRRPGTASLTVFAILAAIVPRSGAHAASSSNSAKERAAKTACLSGDYSKGVALLAELYMKTNDINYLFNQGRCYEQNARYEEAVARFREYERKKTDAGFPPDEDAAKHIAECQSMIDRRITRQPPAAIAPSAGVATSSPTQPEAGGVALLEKQSSSTSARPNAILAPHPSPTSEEAVKQHQALILATPDVSASDSTGRGLRMAGIATMGIGLVGVVAGIVCNLKANSLTDELAKSPLSYSREKDSSRARYETASWVGYGIGGVGVVTGAILYYLGYRAAHGSGLSAVAVTGPDLIGAAAKGSF